MREYISPFELIARKAALENGWVRPVVMEAPDFIPREMTLEEELESVTKELRAYTYFFTPGMIPNYHEDKKRLETRLLELETEAKEKEEVL